MKEAEKYRRLAADFASKAKVAPADTLKAEYAKMAAAYLRLAEHAERRSHTETSDAQVEALAKRMVGESAVWPKA